MRYECKNCGALCCRNTEMILSEKDINLIIRNLSQSKIRQEDFTFQNEDFFQLKNIESNCFFLNNESKICNIYEFRPYGCRFYPMIYDDKKKLCLVDNECPRTHLFYQSSQEFKKTCKKVMHFLREQLKIDV